VISFTLHSQADISAAETPIKNNVSRHLKASRFDTKQDPQAINCSEIFEKLQRKEAFLGSNRYVEQYANVELSGFTW
jgi:hypothetical protein